MNSDSRLVKYSEAHSMEQSMQFYNANLSEHDIIIENMRHNEQAAFTNAANNGDTDGE